MYLSLGMSIDCLNSTSVLLGTVFGDPLILLRILLPISTSNSSAFFEAFLSASVVNCLA